MTCRRGTLAVACGLLLGLLALLPAAAEIGYQGWEVRGGLVLPHDYDGGFAFGVAVDLGEVWERTALFPALFYSLAEDETLFWETEISDLAVGADLRYTPASAPAWYFGGGPYLHRIDRDITEDVHLPGGRSRFSESDHDLSATGVAGYRRTLGGLDAFAEVRANRSSAFDGAFLLVGFSF